ncbi:MAG: hypothetical protein ABI846_13725, partial [Rudaea sp.]
GRQGEGCQEDRQEDREEEVNRNSHRYSDQPSNTLSRGRKAMSSPDAESASGFETVSNKNLQYPVYLSP